MPPVPVTLILDDSGPVNIMALSTPQTRNVPVRFLERFAEATESTGMRGKFTLLPYPCGWGRLDEGIPGYPPEELERFLAIVRDRIAPLWDITPEILTHDRALDLKSGAFHNLREDDWAKTQNADGLTEYFIHALTILKNINIPANGITSPWSFGREVEEAYAEAVGRSLREVFDLEMTWYFLHFGSHLTDVHPRIMARGQTPGTGVVSIVGGTGDPWWPAQDHADPAAAGAAMQEELDSLLAPDGTGRIAELVASNQPVVLLTHWQSLFSNGHGAGLDALTSLAEKINERFGDQIEWTVPSEMARRALKGTS